MENAPQKEQARTEVARGTVLDVVLRDATLASTGAPTRARSKLTWAWSIGWTVVAVAIACVAAMQGGHTGWPLVFTAAAFGVLTFPMMLYGMTSATRDAAAWLRNQPHRLVYLAFAYVGIYLAYALGTGAFSWSAFGRISAFVTIPTVLSLWAGQQRRLTWQDLLAVFCIWVPFDTGLLSEIWAWPKGEAAYIINTSLAVTMAVTLFVGWRGFPEINFRFAWTRRNVLWATAGLAAFCVVGLPIGFATDFIKFNPQLELGKVLGAPLGIFFFIAIPEELLFRGIVQNFLTRLTKSPLAGLALASVFFGATHLNNEPLYDWRFFLLATIAGFAYGYVYQRTKSLLAPALTHAAVDVIWLLLLHT